MPAEEGALPQGAPSHQEVGNSREGGGRTCGRALGRRPLKLRERQVPARPAAPARARPHCALSLGSHGVNPGPAVNSNLGLDWTRKQATPYPGLANFRSVQGRIWGPWIAGQGAGTELRGPRGARTVRGGRALLQSLVTFATARARSPCPHPHPPALQPAAGLGREGVGMGSEVGR